MHVTQPQISGKKNGWMATLNCVKSNFLYAHDSALWFLRKNVTDIQNIISNELEGLSKVSKQTWQI